MDRTRNKRKPSGKTRSRRARETTAPPEPGVSDTSHRLTSLGSYMALLLNAPSEGPLRCPVWPPDLFAVAASVLYQTGEYRQIVRPGPDNDATVGTSSPWRKARGVGREWRSALEKQLQTNGGSMAAALSESRVIQWWNSLLQSAHVVMSDLDEKPEVVDTLLKLFFASDEACAGLGMTHLGACKASTGEHRDLPPLNEAPTLLGQANRILTQLNRGRTLCLQVHPDTVCVLPKLHTAQVGLTLRSLSHNLALCRAAGIAPLWNGPYHVRKKNKDALNILLLPWPDEFHADSIEAVAPDSPRTDGLRDASAYFRYRPKRMPVAEFSARLESAIKGALESSGEIHAIVFPELSLDVSQFFAAERIAWRHGVMLIAGVQWDAGVESLNLCVIQALGLSESNGDQKDEADLLQRLQEHRFAQSKHHRWCIDRNQILQYRLGGRLPASRRWWEHIAIPSRRVNFVAMENWLTWCVLICEDLARQDPAAQVLRAVGPNLVIALLMDGPQILQRWPARYASVLAEDPGSSVLTLSNLGMVRRSQKTDALQPRDPPVTESVVALWSDRVHGKREIALHAGEDACVLNLVCHSEDEFTADGHSDSGRGHFVVYAGHHTFSSKQSLSRQRKRAGKT